MGILDSTGLGFDFIRRWPFLTGFAFVGLAFSFEVGEGDFDFEDESFVWLASASNRPLKKSGSPRSSDSSFRSPAAPSLRAWLVFSMAFLSPISDLERNETFVLENEIC